MTLGPQSLLWRMVASRAQPPTLDVLDFSGASETMHLHSKQENDRPLL